MGKHTNTNMGKHTNTQIFSANAAGEGKLIDRKW